MTLKNQLDEYVLKLSQAFQVAKNGAKVGISEVWRVLQLAIVEIVLFIENNAPKNYTETGEIVVMPGTEKKQAAMDAASRFYDLLYITIDIPFMPGWVRRILHPYAKALFMKCVSGSIDATVKTLNKFNKKG